VFFWGNVAKIGDSLVVRYLPILLSLVTFVFVLVDHQAREELLQIKVRLNDSNETALINRKTGFVSPYFIDISYDVELFNNSDVALSVSSMQVYWLIDGESFSYPTINQGLYDQNGQRAAFPINIDPGKGKKFKQVVGLNLRDKIAKTVLLIHGEGVPFNIYQMEDRIMRYLQEQAGVCSVDKQDIIDSRLMANPMEIEVQCTTGRSKSYQGVFAIYI
jgi:hypothetical protein